MSKAKKGLLTAGSIVSIVSSAAAILFSFLLLIFGFMFNEELIKETYLSDPLTYTYVEEYDGSYYFYEEVDGEVIITHEEDIELAATMVRVICSVTSVIMVVTGIPKLILAIVILAKKSKGVYAKGATITIFVLSCICGNLAEFILFLIAMCVKTNVARPIETEQETQIAA